MICVSCDRNVDWAAAFCPVCGADPHLGASWLATSHLTVGSDGTFVVPASERPGDAGLFELVTKLLYPAWLIASAESSVFRVWASVLPGACGPELDEWMAQLRAAHEAAVAKVEEALPLFRSALAAITEARDQGRVDDDALSTRYNEVPWALGEYGVYLEELGHDELMKTLWTRMLTLAGRWRMNPTETYVDPDGRFSMDYDRAVLDAIGVTTDEFREVFPASRQRDSAVYGVAALGLVPAAWRHWEDLAMAPPAGLFVYVLDNPLAAVTADRLGWSGDRAGACEYYGRQVFGDDWQPDDAKPCTFAGLPAVRVQRFEPGAPSLLVDWVWVRGESAIYTLMAYAPEQRVDLCAAVWQAMSRFAPEGRFPACLAAAPAGDWEPPGALDAPEAPGERQDDRH